MTWIIILIYMLIANFVGNVIVKISLLILEEFYTVNDNQVLPYLLTAAAIYIKFKLIMWLMKTYRRDYDQHLIAIWIFSVIPPIIYKTYLTSSFGDVSELVYPSLQVTIDTIANVVFAYYISKVLHDEAEAREQDRIKQLRIAETQRIADEEKQDVGKSVSAEKNVVRQAGVLLPSGLPESVKTSYKSVTINKPVDDEHFYKAALDEFEEDEKVPETWAKAITLCMGDEERAKWKYIELRVEYLLSQQVV